MANDTEFALSVLSSDNLPEPIEDVAHFVLIAPEILKAQKAEIQACEKMNVAKDIVDAKRDDLNRANELLIEAKVRLGEFSRNIPNGEAGRPSNNRASERPISKRNEFEKIGIPRRNMRDYEKMTSEAFEIERDKARKENRPPEQRNVIQIAETLDKRRREDFANSYKVYRDMEESEKTELQKKLEEEDKKKKYSDSIDKPIRAVWAMPLDDERIKCFCEYALYTDNKALKHHLRIISEGIDKLNFLQEKVKQEIFKGGKVLEVIKYDET